MRKMRGFAQRDLSRTLVASTRRSRRHAVALDTRRQIEEEEFERLLLRREISALVEAAVRWKTTSNRCRRREDPKTPRVRTAVTHLQS